MRAIHEYSSWHGNYLTSLGHDEVVAIHGELDEVWRTGGRAPGFAQKLRLK